MKKNKQLPSVDTINYLLDYCEQTGALTWKERTPDMFECTKKESYCSAWNKKNAGKIAGSKHKEGYIQIEIKGENYLAHRIIGKIIFGNMDESYIDHINGNRKDNRKNNLRKVSRQQNLQNRCLSKQNTSGSVGVAKTKNGKWRSYITIKGKQKHLGVFDEKEKAIKARKDAAMAYGFHENHGRAA